MSPQVFVGNLPSHTSKERLLALFEQAGHHARSAALAVDRSTGRHRGFGFVELTTPEEAETVVEEMNGVVLDGRPLTLNPVSVPTRA